MCVYVRMYVHSMYVCVCMYISTTVWYAYTYIYIYVYMYIPYAHFLREGTLN
jgi:hypothetical protein